MGTWRKLAFMLLVTGLGATSAFAAERVLTLDDPGGGACHNSWIENGCTIELVNTTSADCMTPGNCWFSGDYFPGGLYFPYRMEVNLRTLNGIDRVEVDVYDGWEIGCVQAWLFSGGPQLAHVWSVQIGAWDTLTLYTNGTVATDLVISGWDGAVDEIRIIGDELTPVAASAWGTVKALY